MTWPILASLDAADRSSLEAELVPRTFRKGEVIFHASDPGESLHLIESGLAAIRVTSPYGDELTLNVLGPGSYVGELALIRSDRQRTATAVALEATKTRMLTRAAFDRARRLRPALEQFLLEMLADRVDALGARLLETSYESVDRRCGRRLLELAQALGDGKSSVTVPLTQEDVAALVGSTRPTVNQALRKMEGRGWLKLTRGRIEICKPADLAEWVSR